MSETQGGINFNIVADASGVATGMRKASAEMKAGVNRMRADAAILADREAAMLHSRIQKWSDAEHRITVAARREAEKRAADMRAAYSKQMAAIEMISARRNTGGSAVARASSGAGAGGIMSGAMLPGLMMGGAGVGAAGVVALGLKGAATASMDFEQAFAGVKKTVNASDSELKNLERDLLTMSTQIPVTAEELSRIAATAGQLGIKTGNIKSFTRVIADLGVATNLVGEEGATALARWMNITGLAQDKASNLASTIVALGNTTATTEKEIADMAMNLAGGGHAAKLTDAEIAALSASLTSVGINAEAGGTAFSKVLQKMRDAVDNGGAALDGFAKTAGMTANQFAESFRQRPAEAVSRFVAGLGDVAAKGGNTSMILTELELTDERLVRSLVNLSGGAVDLAQKMAFANKAFADNNALTKEAEKYYETNANKLKTLSNEWHKLSIEIGNSMALGKGVDVASGILKAFDDAVSGAIMAAGITDFAVKFKEKFGTAFVPAVSDSIKSALETAINGGLSAAANAIPKVADSMAGAAQQQKTAPANSPMGLGGWQYSNDIVGDTLKDTFGDQAVESKAGERIRKEDEQAAAVKKFEQDQKDKEIVAKQAAREAAGGQNQGSASSPQSQENNNGGASSFGQMPAKLGSASEVDLGAVTNSFMLGGASKGGATFGGVSDMGTTFGGRSAGNATYGGVPEKLDRIAMSLEFMTALARNTQPVSLEGGGVAEF